MAACCREKTPACSPPLTSSPTTTQTFQPSNLPLQNEPPIQPPLGLRKPAAAFLSGQPAAGKKPRSLSNSPSHFFTNRCSNIQTGRSDLAYTPPEIECPSPASTENVTFSPPKAVIASTIDFDRSIGTSVS
jgi:hypothetical protein